MQHTKIFTKNVKAWLLFALICLFAPISRAAALCPAPLPPDYTANFIDENGQTTARIPFRRALLRYIDHPKTCEDSVSCIGINFKLFLPNSGATNTSKYKEKRQFVKLVYLKGSDNFPSAITKSHRLSGYLPTDVDYKRPNDGTYQLDASSASALSDAARLALPISNSRSDISYVRIFDGGRKIEFTYFNGKNWNSEQIRILDPSEFDWLRGKCADEIP